MKGIVAITGFFLLLSASSVAGPIILLRDDIADEYEEAPEALKTTTGWFGLYVDPASSKVKEARLKLVSRHEESRTVYSIISDPPNAEILFSQVPVLSSGPAVTAGRYADIGPENREVQFKVGNRVYIVRLLSNNEDLCDAVVTLSDGTFTQKLFQPNSDALFSCDEPHFRIHWAGDLDRDGRIDLLATFSPKYSFFPRQLFLSSAAGNGNLVSEVAIFTRFAQ